ncbi:UDP-glucose 4-epimerase GalE [Crenothrix sp. D3]|nr:UDP-glucose 4-epimerase GalE [Crenothrix sp. D3]
MNILITGGAGYIGTHTCVELLEAGHEIIVVDNFSNSLPVALERVEKITAKSVLVYEADISDSQKMSAIFSAHVIDAVIHFAGFKAVGESVKEPLKYYANNVNGTLVLLAEMQRAGVKTLVFSSSATVYGLPETLPIKESFPTSATNPYGRTKLMIEEILSDFYLADDSWRIGILRYFNPVGAHKSGQIGESPNDIPNNLMPFISQIAVGKRDKLRVFGGDYPTPDGTGIRDYIHVIDLAKGHLSALNHLAETQQKGMGELLTVNLGTGQGYSVLEMIKAFEKASGKTIPFEIVARRSGDIAACYSDSSYAKQMMGWKPLYGLEDMCKDAWHWQKNNPNGYEK